MVTPIADRVLETSMSGGAGNLNLLGAAPGGFSTFYGRFGSAPFLYTAVEPIASRWETGVATVSPAGVLQRPASVINNIYGTTVPVTFTGSLLSVYCAIPAENDVFLNQFGIPNYPTFSPLVTASGTTIASATNFIPIDNTTGGAFSILLPASPAAQEAHTIKDWAGNAGTHPITIGGNGKAIDGAASFALVADFDAVSLSYVGGAWAVT